MASRIVPLVAVSVAAIVLAVVMHTGVMEFAEEEGKPAVANAAVPVQPAPKPLPARRRGADSPDRARR